MHASVNSARAWEQHRAIGSFKGIHSLALQSLSS